MIFQIHFYFTVEISAEVGVAWAPTLGVGISTRENAHHPRRGMGLSNGLMSHACGGI